MDKIKLVVIDEHTLGYILPGRQHAGILHTSNLRGSSESIGSSVLTKGRKVRLANEQDFHDFRVCFDGYKRKGDEYEFDPAPMVSTRSVIP